MTKKQKEIDSSKLAEIIANAIDDKKGEDILLIDLREIGSAVTDYFVICTANSPTHIDGIKKAIEEKSLKIAGEKPWHIEGTSDIAWVLMDYVNVVVHIFLPEKREFFNLEGLWADAEIKEIKTAEN